LSNKSGSIKERNETIQHPVSLCHTDFVATFKRHLKTLLFTYGVTDN